MTIVLKTSSCEHAAGRADDNRAQDLEHCEHAAHLCAPDTPDLGGRADVNRAHDL